MENIKPRSRCSGCKYARVLEAHDGYKSMDCTVEKGKSLPVWEVEVCPIGKGTVKVPGYMEKKEKLKARINEFVSTVVDKADYDEKLDYFNIEISNHNGNLQMDYSLRDRKKVY